MRILVTTTSFIDTPGLHHERLKEANCEVVSIRGPLSQDSLLRYLDSEAAHNQELFDGVICGEDEISKTVLDRLAPRLRVVSKYGVGLDKIDVEYAKQLGIVVCNTPGSNHTTVTELAFGLMLATARRIPEENNIVHRSEWRRFTGVELAGKTLAIIGFGRVGKEVAKRAMCFGMNVGIFNTSWSTAHQHSINELAEVFSHPLFSEYPPSIRRYDDDAELLAKADFISLHMNLTQTNRNFMNRRRIQSCKRGAYIINVSRGALIDQNALAHALKTGQIAAYGADVVDPEPISPDNPHRGLTNAVLTPHIGSRTRESVERQGILAVENLLHLVGLEKAS